MSARSEYHRENTRSIRFLRATIQGMFLALFIFLSFRTARVPAESIPSNFLIRFDPSAAVLSALNSRDMSVLIGYYPAWIILFLALFAGRFFCAWLCPLGTCFDIAGVFKPPFFKKKSGKEEEIKAIRGEKKNTRKIKFRTKYLLLIVLILLSFFGINMLFFSSPLSISNRFVAEVKSLRVPYFLLILLFLSFVLPSRFWCETVCPTGALISVFAAARKMFRRAAWLPGVMKEPDLCIKCGKCYINCDFSVIDPFESESHGLIASAECTSCGDCIMACPSPGALSLSILRPVYPRKKTFSPGARQRKELHQIKGSEAGDKQSLDSHRDETITRTSNEKNTTRSEVFSLMNSIVIPRREFIAGGTALLMLCLGYVYGASVDKPVPLLRMPGAQDEKRFLTLCARCGECIRICPAKCLFPTGLEGGFQKIWTPGFIPREAPCIFDQCEHACAESCPTKAIAKTKASQVKIGTAQIDRRRCLGFRGKSCLVCKERCRFSAIKADGLRPIVIADICTGCGSCENTCPTEPPSIRVLPAGENFRFNQFNNGRFRRRGAS